MRTKIIFIVLILLLVDCFTHEPERPQLSTPQAGHAEWGKQDFSWGITPELELSKLQGRWLSVQGSPPDCRHDDSRNPKIKKSTVVKPLSFTYTYARKIRDYKNSEVLEITKVLEEAGYDYDLQHIKNEINNIFPSLNKIKDIQDTEAKIISLYKLINSKIINSPKESPTFELPDVLHYKEASCLGYSHLSYVLGKIVGLDMEIINIYPNHNANLVKTGEEYYIFDIAQDYISRPFKWRNNYEKLDKSKVWVLKEDAIIDFTYDVIGRMKNNFIIPTLNSEFGNLAFDIGKYEEAIIYWKKAYRESSNFFRPAYNLGVVYSKLGSRYMKKFKNAENSRRKLSYLLKASDYFNKSVKWCNQTLQINPYFSNAYEVKGHALVRLNREERAGELFEKAKALRKRKK